MSLSDDGEDNLFAQLLESEMSSSDEVEEEPKPKRQCIEKDKGNNSDGESAVFSKVPTEILRQILKSFSAEDLVSCSLVCKSLNFAAADESLWCCLYSIRWGLTPPPIKLPKYTWKKHYINRDKQVIKYLLIDCPTDFKEYYIQMEASKRSQVPLPSQMVDDHIILDKTVLEQVSMWKKSMGITYKIVTRHRCSGIKCTFHQIGDVFICKETGNVHVCDYNCKGDVFSAGTWVCTISGHCFDNVVMRRKNYNK